MRAFPVVAAVTPADPDVAAVRRVKTAHLVVGVDDGGPRGDQPAATVWAWDRVTNRPYRAIVGDPDDLVEIAVGHWQLTGRTSAGDPAEATIEHDPDDCACSHPMKTWRPPGARRTEVTARRPEWGTAETDGTQPAALR